MDNLFHLGVHFNSCTRIPPGWDPPQGSTLEFLFWPTAHQNPISTSVLNLPCTSNNLGLLTDKCLDSTPKRFWFILAWSMAWVSQDFVKHYRCLFLRIWQFDSNILYEKAENLEQSKQSLEKKNQEGGLTLLHSTHHKAGVTKCGTGRSDMYMEEYSMEEKSESINRSRNQLKTGNWFSTNAPNIFKE